MRSCDGSSTPGRYARFSRSASSRRDCSGVRVCSVVRDPPRVSSTARAVPNEPAPMTVARVAPAVGRERPRARAALEPLVAGVVEARGLSGETGCGGGCADSAICARA